MNYLNELQDRIMKNAWSEFFFYQKIKDILSIDDDPSVVQNTNSPK
ncbi:MAG: hypothetical protein EA361_07860 [Bacteroidetes bacterium]|nr:MAG: hypothetical protein EA361_07860 [Bacteroidota bacterium]